MWKNKFKIKTKPSHVTFKFTTRSTVRFSPQTNQWYLWKDGVTVWQSIGRFLVNNFVNVWPSMMSGHGANPIFCNKKIKIGSQEHLLPPPPTSDNISFLPYPNTPPPSKWTSYVYVICCITLYKSKSNHLDNCCYYKKLENALLNFSVDKKQISFISCYF